MQLLTLTMVYWASNSQLWWNQTHHEWKGTPTYHEVLTGIWHVQAGINVKPWIWSIFRGKWASKNLEYHFNHLFMHGSFLSLDEYLVCEFGQMKFKVRIRTKLAHYGIKIYVVTYAETTYVLKSIVYIGGDMVYSSDTNVE